MTIKDLLTVALDIALDIAQVTVVPENLLNENYKEEFETVGCDNFSNHFFEGEQDFFGMDAELLDKEVIAFTVDDEEGNPFYPKTLTIVYK